MTLKRPITMKETIYITDKDLLRVSVGLLIAGVMILTLLASINGWIYLESSLSGMISDLVQLFINGQGSSIREDNLPSFFAG